MAPLRVCLCVCVFSRADMHAWDTAISQDALVMFGDGGLRIGLCACIQNRPIYQLADTLRRKSILSTSDMMEVLPSLHSSAAQKRFFFVLKVDKPGRSPELLKYFIISLYLIIG